MKEFWSRRIRDAVPYVPGEQPKDRVFIKLNTNENPYPPSPRAVEALKGAAGEGLRLYPDPECTLLRKAVAEFYALDPEQVFCGNGSDEILAFAFQAFFDPDRPVTFADVTYSFYEVWAKYLGLSVRLVPLKEDFSTPVEDFLEGPTGGMVIANPNAPTGQVLAGEDLRAILKRHPDQVVVVDEAYIDFGGESVAPWVDTYPNLLVVQTASKSWSLAGLRVGWAIGDKNLMAALRCVRDSVNSYTVDRAAQAAAAAALEDRAWFDETRGKIMATRERTTAGLRALGFTVGDSKANFLFASHPKMAGKALLTGLREKGVLVRWFDRPRIDNYLRISIGTDEEMEALLSALGELVK